MEVERAVLVIGGGAFGKAMASLLRENDIQPTIVDQGEYAQGPFEFVILALPVQLMRQALIDNSVAFVDETVVVSCSKGIEQGEALLPHQIFASLGLRGKYHALSGPSFAKEILEHVPTVVDIAGEGGNSNVPAVVRLLSRPYFRFEEHDSVLELELAGALKNVYAIAAGFLSEVGGGGNTHAHLQVVALREYQTLARALTGGGEVVRPSIVGDLYLTCGSIESRNYRFGVARAKDEMPEGLTAEGSDSVTPLLSLAEKESVSLPLAKVVGHIVEQGSRAKKELFSTLGFKDI